MKTSMSRRTRPFFASTALGFTLTLAAIMAIVLSPARGLSQAPATGAALARLDSAPRSAAAKPAAPVVQLVLLLDTSNSMDGLIEQAKSQLWKIVNEFISAKQNGQRPDLQVALFEYGKSSLSSKDGYIRLIQSLTNDLDKISEELFALRTNGGEEYCGWVIQEAVKRLAWDPSGNAYKAIFIAGNEPFTQGPVSYVVACKAAIEKGIIVNTIHCGSEREGVATKWQNGAVLAEGKYMVIDQNRAVVHVEAPQDKDIAALGVALNKTYVGYGASGALNLERQSSQDANSTALAPQGSAVQRSLFKASGQYRNDTWDLVDARREGKVKLNELKPADLPDEMKKMTVTEQQSYLDAKAQERAKLQQEIARLNGERARYLAQQTQPSASTNTLDSVVINAIREQAGKRNYRFE
jgi:hypothetical protein